MKAISIKNGIVTGIVLNEACSAGCGSFIETYAKSLKIPVHEISKLAFNSKKPSRLGSRCTVFMNSSIVTEQKNGKTTEDIMAGICKSIIENVFTKVVRVPNFNMLGDVVMVQGGTFKNDAVLRALEQYTQRKVVRAKHPGEMGAIGIALLTKKYIKEKTAKQKLDNPSYEYESTFIGLENLDEFGYEKIPGNICKFCSNNCNRTIVKFNDGSNYITGNRCERGEIIGDPKDKSVKEQLKETTRKINAVPDMMSLRNKLLFKDYDPKLVSNRKDITIGIPRTLEFWNSAPFWNTLFTALGFKVVFSKKSDYKLFESGLNSVASDTVCFPAKLAHGHIKDLIKKSVDRIFMPMMIKIPTENKSTTGVHICAVIQGYPLVIKESDEPESKYNIPFDHPVFHWYSNNLRDKQIIDFIQLTFGLPIDVIKEAIKEGDKAQQSFLSILQNEGEKIIESLEGTNDFAVVLAGRPYHTDALVNHNLSSHFTRLGIPVLTVDSLPKINKTDLSKVRADTVNPFHVRMYGAAVYGARNPNLEVVQIVSFGCGHDAIITDEMIRLMGELSNKQLLVLKLDEGEAVGPLNIRIKSFIQTIIAKRKKKDQLDKVKVYKKELPEPFKIKFYKSDKELKTILVPNLSVAFCKLASSIMKKLGYKVESLPLADERAIELGKKYVHNDICFPAQINVGEVLAAIESGKYNPDHVVAGFAKNCDDCRAGQYATLARKALDDAGYPQIPIITTGSDNKGMHPGFKLGIDFQLNMLWGLSITDAMEDMLRKTRPYEINEGETDKVFDEYINNISDALENGYRKAIAMFKEAVEAFNNIPTDRRIRKPRVFIIGEILLNYHPAANGYIERYLEQNGMETILPSMVDFFRRDLIRIKEGVKKNQVPYPFLSSLMANLTDKIYDYAFNKIDKIQRNFKFYDSKKNIHELAENIEDFIDKTYMVGEGWSIPADIIENIEEGVNSFIIVQPFGCLPNHITGRGMIKTIKKRYPYVQILSLDYDPDTSFANIENRLQMLIISAKETEKAKIQKEKVKTHK
jgi:predicted nucleotide-binding protein (sugar kinase/HSP70/actin superfamily)